MDRFASSHSPRWFGVALVGTAITVAALTGLTARSLHHRSPARERTATGDRLTSNAVVTRVIDGDTLRYPHLTVEIDRSRVERDVDEIVETDFFRDLQARATEMRRRDRDRSTDA